MAQSVGLRKLDSVPGRGRLFLFTAGKKLAQKLYNSGMEYPRMFKMWMGTEPVVVATHPDVARAILTRPNDFIKTSLNRDGRPRIMSLLTYDASGQEASIVSDNGQRWAAMRKPIDPAFEKQALAHLVPKFAAVSKHLVDIWAVSRQPVDAKRDMSRFALDILGVAVLGRTFHALDGSFQETYSHYSTVVSQMVNPLYLVFPSLERLPLRRNVRLRESVAHMRAVLQGAIDQRLEERRRHAVGGAAEGEPQDIMDMLLGPGTNPDGVLQAGQLVPVLWLMFLAGHDTTAISLTWLMYFLGQNPGVQAKARAEALAVLDGAAEPTPEMLERVPYISALISEGLRLRPPVYNLPTRECAEDTELDGVLLPKGTKVGLHVGAINRHPEAWDRPDAFDPERFLKKADRSEKGPRVFNFLPFSAGPRRCLGDKLSLMEQKTLLMTLLSRLEVLPERHESFQDVALSSDSISISLLQCREMRLRVRPIEA